MVNLIAAIIVSAVVGFLAGHFFTAGNDQVPVSLKEAVTGDLDAPPQQFNLPRPPSAPPDGREDSREWLRRRLDGYAPLGVMPADADSNGFWKGAGSFSRGGRDVRVEVGLNIFDESCRDLAVMITAGGRRLPVESAGACGSSLRKRGENFYFSWVTVHDDTLGPVVSALLIPVPGSSGAIEFLDSPSGQWMPATDFQWSASSSQELEDARLLHMKEAGL